MCKYLLRQHRITLGRDMLRSQGDVDSRVKQREDLEDLQMPPDKQGYSALTRSYYWLVSV